MKTKYLFIGNMNNMCYMFAREMKSQGHDVTLWINAPQKYTLDRPEAFDQNLKYPYPDWIVEMTEKERIDVTHLPLLPFIAGRYMEMIKKHDVIILNGNWTSLGKYIPKDKKIIGLFAGDDMSIYCNPEKAKYLADYISKKKPFLFLLYPVFYLLSKFIINERRKSLKRMIGINYFPKGIDPASDKIIEDVKKGMNYSRLNLRGIPLDTIQFSEIKKGNKFNILNFTRFIYTDKSLAFNKRNDIMIEGIADFIKQNNLSKNDVAIHFFEKGNDVENAKVLLKELEISEYITWNKPVSQIELDEYIQNCDVSFDQLGEHWVGYGVFVMAMGRPIIANGRPEIFDEITKEKSPICQSKTREEVSNWLTLLYNDYGLRCELGRLSSEYVRNHYNIKKTTEYLTSFKKD